jgi:hypothetical protein
MTRPRVFISSTFYDLRQVRADLERFVREIGYEPVQHERGHVPYGSMEKLESYCYKEIAQVDIVVNIVGGRFGSVSFDEANSISQMELKTAVKMNKQCYVFVDAAVYAEYRLYLRNKGLAGLQFAAADDQRILTFIEDIEALPRNNQLIEFRNADEIAAHLREQWAGLFQRFLQEQEQLPDRRAADELHVALGTVNQLITFLTTEKRDQGSAINEILLANHPVFEQIRRVTTTPYPVFFRTRKEMQAWLNARNWRAVEGASSPDPKTTIQWRYDYENGTHLLLNISSQIFKADRLRVFTAAEWNPDWVKVVEIVPPPKTSEQVFAGSLADEDDDLPF